MMFNLQIETDEGANEYLEVAARIRGISRTVLLKRVLERVLHDQLIFAILDDTDDARCVTPPRKPRSIGGQSVSERMSAIVAKLRKLNSPATCNELGGQINYAALKNLVANGTVVRLTRHEPRVNTVLYELQPSASGTEPAPSLDPGLSSSPEAPTAEDCLDIPQFLCRRADA